MMNFSKINKCVIITTGRTGSHYRKFNYDFIHLNLSKKLIIFFIIFLPMLFEKSSLKVADSDFIKIIMN